MKHGIDDEEFFCLPDASRKTIIAEAVNKAIDWCIDNDVLKEFFQEYREEASRVSILEYSAERHLQAIKDEGYDIGHEDGLKQGLKQGITASVELLKDMELDDATIIQKICEKYKLTPEQANKYL
jgi:flagellar biosynthesis/type III secretory pathway protein FliH